MHWVQRENALPNLKLEYHLLLQKFLYRVRQILLLCSYRLIHKTDDILDNLISPSTTLNS